MKKEILKIIPAPIPFSNNEEIAYFPVSMLKQLNLREEAIYTLRCGINSLPVRIRKIPIKNISKDVLWLTGDIIKKTSIPEGITMEVTFTEERIRIGPIIGILTDNKFLKDYMNGTDSVEEYSLYADAAEEARALIYVFSLRNLNSRGKYINGFMPERDENNKWKWSIRCLPIPDAVCNRMAVASSSPSYKTIKSMMEIYPDIKIINKVTKISKWTIAKLLQRDPMSKNYIPDTHMFGNPLDIIKMLEKYPEIYLKPVRRSLGLGIIKMEKKAEGDYTAFYNVNGVNLNTNGDINSILAELREVMGKRIYIVQQGIPVALYRGKPFDLRVTIQKDGTGKWSFTRWSARVAGPGNIVSNVAAGGRGYPAEKILGEIFGPGLQVIKDEVKKAGLIIAEALDKRLSGIGDLGLDIGIDIYKGIYLFEANFRAIRPEDLGSRCRRDWIRTYHTPVHYLRYLYDVEMEGKNNPRL